MINFPNSKINIGLQILSKRKDNYHNLSTLFYPIQVFDILEILDSEQDKLELSGNPLRGNNKNLVSVALELLRKDYTIPPLAIHLHKAIPDGAGLGGGSSDATHALLLINEKFNLKISEEQLLNYASQIGSDCAFFVKNKALLASGRGNIFTEFPLTDLNKYQIYLVIPPIYCSTASAFLNILPNANKPPLEELLNTPISDWKNCVHNDFEDSLFPQYPLLEQLKSKLYETGAIYASLSGSGSALYGIFPIGITPAESIFPNCKIIEVPQI